MARYTVERTDTEELGDFEGAVLAAVHQGHEVSFLTAVELGLLAETHMRISLWRRIESATVFPPTVSTAH